MTFTRRQLLAAGGAVGVSTLAGCTDALESSLSSTTATIAEPARSETGYDEHTVEPLVIEEPVGRFGIERTLEVTNWYAEYDRAVSLDTLGLSRVQAAVVSVLTTPQVSFLGRTFNPVGEYSTDELVELIQDRYEEVEDVEYRDEESVSVLGTETRMARYRAQARLAAVGTTIDVYLHLTEAISHGDDFVICVAVYPQLLGLGTESASVRTLLEAVEHG